MVLSFPSKIGVQQVLFESRCSFYRICFPGPCSTAGLDPNDALFLQKKAIKEALEL